MLELGHRVPGSILHENVDAAINVDGSRIVQRNTQRHVAAQHEVLRRHVGIPKRSVRSAHLEGRRSTIQDHFVVANGRHFQHVLATARDIDIPLQPATGPSRQIAQLTNRQGSDTVIHLADSARMKHDIHGNGIGGV